MNDSFCKVLKKIWTHIHILGVLWLSLCELIVWVCSMFCWCSVAVLLQCEFADPCQLPWDSTQLLGHWHTLFISFFLSHLHTKGLFAPPHTSSITFSWIMFFKFFIFLVYLLHLCRCGRRPSVICDNIDIKKNSSSSINSNFILQDTHWATMIQHSHKKQTELSADLRGGPVLKSMYSTYWLPKLRVSEFTLHTLKEQGELWLSLEMHAEE